MMDLYIDETNLYHRMFLYTKQFDWEKMWAIADDITDEEVIRETKALDLVSIPGFFTATEGFKAVRAGADYLKLFPTCLGPSYIKDLKAVIKTPIMAVGGVTTENFASFLGVACGAGIGGSLYKPGKPLSETAQTAKLLASIVREKFK